jgi:hypothetical protein
MTKRKVVRLSTLLCFLISAVAVPGYSGQVKQAAPVVAAAEDDHVWNRQVGRFGFEEPGVTISRVNLGYVSPIQAVQHLQLIDGNSTILLKSIDQLRGHVRIKSAQSALRFVRLLTSPETWYLWSDRVESEVIEANTIFDVLAPHIGDQVILFCLPREVVIHHFIAEPGREDLRPYWTYEPDFKSFEQRKYTPENWSSKIKTDGHPDLSAYGNGYLGILSREAFRKGGFSSAKVKRVVGGYEVTRWIFLDSDSTKRSGECIQRVREFVNEDGTYKRTVLEQKTLPKLPGIHWSFPRFE